MWYGVSNIAARLLTYVLTPYFTYVVFSSPGGKVEFGRYSFIYLLLPLMNVLYTYGMETSYFRFSQSEEQKRLYRTQLTAMLATTVLFSLILWWWRLPIAHFANIDQHPEYVGWCAAIIGLDALSAIPYARLRRENRPRKYALTKVAGILVFVLTIVFLFSYGERLSVISPAFGVWYQQHWGTGFILFANILQAAVTLLLLARELRDYRPFLDFALLKKILLYGLPILITGFAGTINDNLNRIMFEKLYPVRSANESLEQLGVYTSAVRLSIMINLAIQAFKMAAEPFFFSLSKDKNAPATYARVMKWFVVALCLMFLAVALFMDVWKYFVGREYREALGLVPILLLSYVFLGIYYNLTVWYKLTDRTQYGMYIMIIGSVVTVVFNWLFIPTWGYAACAWGTLLCYGVMMTLSYAWGQKFYPIPYATGRLLLMMVAMLVFSAVVWLTNHLLPTAWMRLLLGSGLFAGYLFFIWKLEQQELSGILSPLRKKLGR